jgi:hypothetical protein
MFERKKNGHNCSDPRPMEDICSPDLFAETPTLRRIFAPPAISVEGRGSAQRASQKMTSKAVKNGSNIEHVENAAPVGVAEPVLLASS